MNAFQLAQQIKHLLTQSTWPEGTQGKVFGEDVFIYTGNPTEDQIPAGFPFCMVGIGSGSADESQPGLTVQEFSIIIVAEVAGDANGEFAIIGSSIGDIGSSAGRGVAELADRVAEATENLNTFDGVRIQMRTSSMSPPALVAGGRHIVMYEISLEGVCTGRLHYEAPQEIESNGGIISWNDAPAARFDFFRYNVVEKVGSPSNTPEDGVSVYTGTAPTTGSPVGSGGFLTAFAEYDSRGGGVREGFSSPEVGSFV